MFKEDVDKFFPTITLYPGVNMVANSNDYLITICYYWKGELWRVPIAPHSLACMECK